MQPLVVAALAVVVVALVVVVKCIEKMALLHWLRVVRCSLAAAAAA